VSLIVVMVARYAFSVRFIWRQTDPVADSVV
jgi:hypothetical protein